MGFWHHLREEPLTTRLAGPGDRAAVAELLARTWRRQGNLAAEDQVALLQAGISPLAVAQDEAIGFLGLSQRSVASAIPHGSAETWVDVDLVALNPDRRPERVLSALLEWVLPLLRRRGCSGLVCLTSLSWLQESLVRAGFRQEDQVITYVHTHHRLDAVPEPAQMRAAGGNDADTVLAINARAFAPFWQYDDSVVLSWLLTADRAALAYVDGRPAGFALTTDGLPGNYAHLIRIATDPDFQGRGVGRQLVHDALQHAYAADAPGLALNTQASNRGSRRLYESLGFRPTGQALSVLVYRFG
jgi:GNAT superfamily N-acetyltransferase